MKVKILGTSAQDIFESVRELHRIGSLQAGDTLPPVRELAQSLGVNRNTVSSAYQRLSQAGIAITQGRLGTRICEAAKAGEQEGATNTALFDLADGSPRLEWLPDLNKVAGQSKLNQYLYGENTMLSDIKEHARNWFSNDCSSHYEVTLCNGAIDSLERLMAAHLIVNDKVVVEDPCYISSANCIRQAGMQVVGAQVDEFGIQPEALKNALEKGAKAVLITPRAHNPTGASISAKRATQIKAVLSDYPNVLVMEDDHFSLLAITNYHSVIPESTHHWAIFRSVSKGLGPDLRMAFVAADRVSVAKINTRLAPGMSWVSRVLQSLVFTCLSQKTFTSHLQKAKENCVLRRNFLLKALKHEGIETPQTQDGLNVWINTRCDAREVTYALAHKGWLVRPGTSFDINQNSQALRVSVRSIDKNIAAKFAKDLAVVIQNA